MLQYIEFEDVGPAKAMAFEFAPRINILTGDNGLGKTFVLENAWWALTRNWSHRFSKPFARAGAKPRMSFELDDVPQKQGLLKLQRSKITCSYDRGKNNWKPSPSKSADTGIVIYARADSGISVWDSLRRTTVNLTSDGVFDQVKRGPNVICEGLLADWLNWQEREQEVFEVLTRVLTHLSPDDQEKLIPGDPIRLSLHDVREIPTLKLTYGTVPLTHLSAGMKRVISLAYVLVWSVWQHINGCHMVECSPTDRLTLLIDEVEAHLHPQWQRMFLPALLEATREYLKLENLRVQIIATTHAPLVLASMEPFFDRQKDRVIVFDVNENVVSAREQPWAGQGDAANWLVSESFGLEQARSKRAERAIEAAEAFMRGDSESLPIGFTTKEGIHEELLRVVPGHDHFWPRWIVKNEETQL